MSKRFIILALIVLSSTLLVVTFDRQQPAKQGDGGNLESDSAMITGPFSEDQKAANLSPPQEKQIPNERSEFRHAALQLEESVPINDFKDAISVLIDEDREFIEEFNEWMDGALSYRTPNERNWKTRRGYPTIKEVLFARDLSDEELDSWASTGDPVGTLLNHERKLREFVDFQDEHGIDSSNRREALEEFPQYREMIEELQSGRLAILATNSPFSSYLMSAYNIAMRDELFGNHAMMGAAIAGDYYAMQHVESVLTSLRPQMVLSEDGVPYFAYDGEVVDNIMSFVMAGLYQVSGPMERGMICDYPENP